MRIWPRPSLLLLGSISSPRLSFSGWILCVFRGGIYNSTTGAGSRPFHSLSFRYPPGLGCLFNDNYIQKHHVKNFSPNRSQSARRCDCELFHYSQRLVFDKRSNVQTVNIFALLAAVALASVLIRGAWLAIRITWFKASPTQTQEVVFFHTQLGNYASCLVIGLFFNTIAGIIGFQWLVQHGVTDGMHTQFLRSPLSCINIHVSGLICRIQGVYSNKHIHKIMFSLLYSLIHANGELLNRVFHRSHCRSHLQFLGHAKASICHHLSVNDHDRLVLYHPCRQVKITLLP